MADYIPTSDAEFLAWEQNFITYANANLVALGLVAADMTPITTAQTTFQSALTNHIAAQAAAQSATASRDTQRGAFERSIRALVRRLQASPSVANSEKAALGITVKDTIPTMAAEAATRPVGVVDTSQRLRHEIRFFDQATPTKKAKPKGAMGCEIWVKVGSIPADPSECAFLALDTASPYVAQYDGADAGKTAYYLLRWVNTRGEKGPWSETVAATITG